MIYIGESTTEATVPSGMDGTPRRDADDRQAAQFEPAGEHRDPSQWMLSTRRAQVATSVLMTDVFLNPARLADVC